MTNYGFNELYGDAMEYKIFMGIVKWIDKRLKSKINLLKKKIEVTV